MISLLGRNILTGFLLAVLIAAWAQAKDGVLILGYNPAEPNWERTVWGAPPENPGRLVRGAAVALESDAALVVISGGPQKEGKSEAWWMRKRLYDGLNDLGSFGVYPVLQKYSADEIGKRLDAALRLEEKARNTIENLEKTGAMFREAGVDRVILVTSPDHISRALRDALQLWGRDYPELARNVYATASATLYSERAPEDREIAKMENVVVIEPPAARKLRFSRILDVLNDLEAVAEIDAVLKKHGK